MMAAARNPGPRLSPCVPALRREWLSKPLLDCLELTGVATVQCVPHIARMDRWWTAGGPRWSAEGEPRDFFDGHTGELRCDWEAPRQAADGRPLSLAEAFAAAFEQYRDRPCLGARLPGSDAFRWLSYASVFALSRQLAARLAAAAGAPGARVGICGGNDVPWFLADFACLWAGLTSTPVSEAWSVPTIEAVLQKTGATCVVCDGSTEQRVLRIAIAGRVPSLRHVFVAHSSPSASSLREAARRKGLAVQCFEDCFCDEAPEADITVCARRREDPHTVIFTSGTTG